jgi:hypothetical protein
MIRFLRKMFFIKWLHRRCIAKEQRLIFEKRIEDLRKQDPFIYR